MDTSLECGRRSCRSWLRLLRCICVALFVMAACALTPSASRAKTILVVAPHPDDEILIAAGRIHAAVASGYSVKVVVVTNGDKNGTSTGYTRQAESVASAAVLGVPENDVIFLGYGDASLLDIYQSGSGTQLFTSPAGMSRTYGNRGLGYMDYHRYLHGIPGRYDRNTLLGDMRALIRNFRPDEIYTVSAFERHRDHAATALLVMDALVGLERAGFDHAPIVFQSLVWPHKDATCPEIWPGNGFDPSIPFSRPGCMEQVQMDWERTIRFPVPTEMLSTDPHQNLKYRAIAAHRSQFSDWLTSFARDHEVFWRFDLAANLALTAQVTTSSENTAMGQGAIKALDGVMLGYPGLFPVAETKEWATNGQLAGAWIQLDWPAAMTVTEVNLFDRPNGVDNIVAGTLTFSDGTSIGVDALPPDGRASLVSFAPKTVRWLRFTVDRAEGVNIGLSEIEVLGTPSKSPANAAPYFTFGPVPAQERLEATQRTALLASAGDLDGDLVEFSWSTDGGVVEGAGPLATYIAPPVVEETVFTVRAKASDGRGGFASNVSFITVTPPIPPALMIASPSVAGGTTARAIVTLASAAPPGGATVGLTSSDAGSVTVPPALVIPAGASSGAFDVSVRPVSSDRVVDVTATFSDGATRSGSVTVNPPGRSSSLRQRGHDSQ